MSVRSRILKVAVPTAAIVAVAMLVSIGIWKPRTSVRAQGHVRAAEYKCYVLPPGPAVNKEAQFQDQFGTETVKVQQPLFLCNPATKIFNGMTFENPALPHLKCYNITPSTAVKKTVTLKDQFETETNVMVTTPQFVCTEVEKTVQ
jgi:hypothetical protein